MGRRKKPDYLNRDVQLHIRITKAEDKALDELSKLKGVSKSDLIRNLIIDDHLKNLKRINVYQE